MSEAARLTIALDPPYLVMNPLDGKRTRAACEVGGAINGVVRVEVLEKIRTEAVRVRLVRIIAGQRHAERDTIWDEVFYQGVLEADEEVNLAFHASVPPEGPISYEGKLFKVYWQVEALVELAYRLDPKAIEPVAILPRNSIRDAG